MSTLTKLKQFIGKKAIQINYVISRENPECIIVNITLENNVFYIYHKHKIGNSYSEINCVSVLNLKHFFEIFKITEELKKKEFGIVSWCKKYYNNK